MVPYQHVLMVGTKNRLRDWRKERGLSQEQVAEILDLTYPQIGKIERGEQGLREEHVWKLVEIHSCHPGELFDDMPEPNYPEHILELAAVYARMTPEQRDYWLRSGHAISDTPTDERQAREAT